MIIEQRIYQNIGKKKNQRIVDAQGKILGYQCMACGKEFTNVKQLAGHSKSAHKRVSILSLFQNIETSKLS